MWKKQAGQAFILVLILLAIGALVVIPVLGLTSTTVKNSRIVTRQVKAMYAADAAQEYILWKIAYGNLGSQFYEDGQSANFSFSCCGIPVDILVVMRAVEGEGGITLATDDVIKPTKTVTPEQHAYDYMTYTYTIILEQLSSNTSQGLDAIYDMPPGGFGSGAYQVGSSEVSLDGGVTWLPVPNPLWNAAKGYLKWPADYNKDTGAGAFSSDPQDVNHYFNGIRNFTSRQIKMLRFQMYGRLAKDSVHCNWVVLKPWNTLSGPQAPIAVGISNPGCCPNEQSLIVEKLSYPEIIQPGVETDVWYTISIKNDYVQSRDITEITDYLPPGFYYIGPTSSSTDPDILAPVAETININGIEREELTWTQAQFPGGIDLKISSGETITITFRARATKDVSGSYYNEVIALLKETGLPSQAFAEAGVSPYEYGSNYSWNTGTVIVPAYDSRTSTDDITIDANMSLILGGISVHSWQIY